MLTSLRTGLLPPSHDHEADARRAFAALLLRVGLAFLATAAVFFGILFATGLDLAPPPLTAQKCSLPLGWRCNDTIGCCVDDLVCVFYTQEFARCEDLGAH